MEFVTDGGTLRAVDGVTFALAAGETTGIVGESGCGKSVTALSILRLLPRRNARIASGAVCFEGKDLLRLPEAAMRQIRGNRIAMVFQEPMTSLNPVHTIGAQVAETLRIHARLGPGEARRRAEEMLRLVRIPDPTRRMRDYPHHLSGGMRQRAMIAMALACSPKLLIADEPTTALDVTIQAQILRLLRELQERTGASVLLITHDLGVVAETCRRVLVMYAGRIVEEADVVALFDRPAHPYTRGLLQSGPNAASASRRRLAEIPGMVPDLRAPIVGCSFAPRCRFALPLCLDAAPPMRDVAAGHRAACWRAEEVAAS